jgi:hypothetical protein
MQMVTAERNKFIIHVWKVLTFEGETPDFGTRGIQYERRKPLQTHTRCPRKEKEKNYGQLS